MWDLVAKYVKLKRTDKLMSKLIAEEEENPGVEREGK
jgi:hypothetical protein